MRLRHLLVSLMLLLLAAPAAAQPFVTRHEGTFGGQEVSYTATVAETVVADAKGQPAVRFVTTAYVRDGADAARRPVIFLFNGGPSSASAYLHMGALGPKRMVVPADLAAPVPPALVDNGYSPLDAADLVFIDPPETGFSRVLPGVDRAAFYTSDGDAKAVAGFIRAWLAANGRTASPKYVMGESYGTIRAALLAGELAKTGPLEGVILMGQAVNMIETSQRVVNPVGFASNITALAAVAAYHKRVDTHGKSVEAFVDEVYAWGMGEYLQALIKGQDLPARDRARIAGKLAAFTGIPASYYLAHDLAITKVDFRTELLKDKGRVMGNYDARYVGPAAKPGERGGDPFSKVQGNVEPLMKRYLAADLGVTWPAADYRMAAPGTGAWRYDPTGGAGGPFWDYNYPASISAAFKANPKFRLMIGGGYYDLTTTIGPARYMVAKSDWPRDRVLMRDYVGGHMAYTHEPTLERLTDDIRAFVTSR